MAVCPRARGVDPATIHVLGVERQREISVAVDIVFPAARCHPTVSESGTGLSSKTFLSRALTFSSKSDSLGLAQISFSILVLAFAQSKLAECAHGIHIKDITSNDQTVVVFISVHGLSRTHFSSNLNVLGLILMFFR